MRNKTKLNLVLLITFIILVFGTAIITKNNIKKEPTNFEETLTEVQQFWKSQVGVVPRTPIKETRSDIWKYRRDLQGVLAYCWTEQGNEYITFNHDLINLYADGNMDFVFQVIIHEYTHCEAHIGHIEMGGHYMNNGGYPPLTKEEVKDQFKDFRKYYNMFYTKFWRDEKDLNDMYALIIERDSNGKIKTKCSCSLCTGVNNG